MGRPKSAAVRRDGQGRSRGESPESIRAVAILARASRLGELAAHAADPLAATVLGTLYLRWQYLPSHGEPFALSPALYEAGEWYAGVVRRHSAVMGYSVDRYGPGAGAGCGPDFDEETANEIKGDFRNARHALLYVGGVTVAELVCDLCLGRLTLDQAMADIVPIKVGLRALWKMRKL